jgi:hypothetical protein
MLALAVAALGAPAGAEVAPKLKELLRDGFEIRGAAFDAAREEPFVVVQKNMQAYLCFASDGANQCRTLGDQ